MECMFRKFRTIFRNMGGCGSVETKSVPKSLAEPTQEELDGPFRNEFKAIENKQLNLSRKTLCLFIRRLTRPDHKKTCKFWKLPHFTLYQYTPLSDEMDIDLHKRFIGGSYSMRSDKQKFKRFIISTDLTQCCHLTSPI